jgi:hypothetical protein
VADTRRRLLGDWWARLDRALTRGLLFGLDGTAHGPLRVARASRGSVEDRELLAAVLAEYPHDTRAFSRLVEQHWARAWSVCQAILLDAHDAEETVQDTFLKVHRYLPSYRFESRFTTWLYQIARRTALTRLSDRSRRPRGRNRSCPRYPGASSRSPPTRSSFSPRFPESLVLVGAGVIGLEMAAPSATWARA